MQEPIKDEHLKLEFTHLPFCTGSKFLSVSSLKGGGGGGGVQTSKNKQKIDPDAKCGVYTHHPSQLKRINPTTPTPTTPHLLPYSDFIVLSCVIVLIFL